MALKQLTDDEALNLNGTTDDNGLTYPTLLQDDWAAELLRGLYHFLELFVSDLRVLEVDGNADAVAVLAGRALIVDEMLVYAGSGGAAAVDGLTDNDTTYIWAEKSGSALVINSAVDGTGWPATPHVKLATVTMANGAITSLVDLRGAMMLRAITSATASNAGLVKQTAAIADLGQTISGTYSQSEVQAISDKVDALLGAMRTSGQLASS